MATRITVCFLCTAFYHNLDIDRSQVKYKVLLYKIIGLVINGKLEMLDWQWFLDNVLFCKSLCPIIPLYLWHTCPSLWCISPHYVIAVPLFNIHVYVPLNDIPVLLSMTYLPFSLPFLSISMTCLPPPSLSLSLSLSLSYPLSPSLTLAYTSLSLS